MKCYFALLLSSSHTKLLLTPVPFKKRTTSYLVDGEEFWISVILIARGKLKRTYKSRHTCCLGCFTEGLPQCAVPPVSAQISRVPSRWRRHSVSLWERTCQNKFDRKKWHYRIVVLTGIMYNSQCWYHRNIKQPWSQPPHCHSNRNTAERRGFA